MSAPTLQVLTGSTYATNITSQVLGEVKVTLESGEVQVSGTPDAAACKAAIESAGFDVVS